MITDVLKDFFKRMNEKIKEDNKNGAIRAFFYWAAAVVFMEISFKAIVFGNVFSDALFYTVIFSLPIAAILYLLTSVFSRRINFIITIVLTLMLFIYFTAQLIYNKVFNAALTFEMIGLANQGFDFFSIILETCVKNWYGILLLLMPLLFVCIFGWRIIIFAPSSRSTKLSAVSAAVIIHLAALLSLSFSAHGETGAYTLYHHIDLPRTSQQQLGVLTEARLDIKRKVFGVTVTNYKDAFAPLETEVDSSSADLPSSSENASDSAQSETPPVPDIQYNIMDIDFDKLIASEKNAKIKEMHKYFSKVEPTKKNEYTGLFKGDNFIFITAESFSPYAIHEKYTPTLYKLAREGIQFTNYYNSEGGTSTTSGEYTATFGLYPTGNSRAPEYAGKNSNYIPFCMGNQFRKLPEYGETFAYHNHNAAYYGRNISHPAMGYTFKALGAGLDVKATWPESDDEMMEKALPDFINQDRFHAYFMTVSGHQAYTFSGNYMASKHKDEVKDLDNLPEGARAYIACNIEFDLMMERLLKALDEAGKLDNTVIVISPDHHPYALKNNGEKSLEALAGHKLDETFDIYKSSLIIWKNNLPRIEVEKPVSGVDIIPTLSNLFGLEYDSRLLMGNDAFSDSPGLVVFNDRSWISEKCKYSSKKGVVENYTDVKYTGDDDYVKKIRATVSQRLEYSGKILLQDYYAYAFGKK